MCDVLKPIEPGSKITLNCSTQGSPTEGTRPTGKKTLSVAQQVWDIDSVSRVALEGIFFQGTPLGTVVKGEKEDSDDDTIFALF